MNHPSVVLEIIGYAGALLVLLSFVTASDFKMHMLSVLGSMAFVIYGVIGEVYPFALLGAILIAIHLYLLIHTIRHLDSFSLLPVSGQDPSCQHFLSYYASDIAGFFPDFHTEVSHDLAFMVYHDATPVGIFLANQISEYEIEVVLDYAVPKFRDYSIGQFLYRQLSHMGYHKAIFHGEYEKHTKYLKKLEFTREGHDYIKTW